MNKDVSSRPFAVDQRTIRSLLVYWPYAILCVLVIGLIVTVSLTSDTLREAVVIGGDECFEVTKAFLCSEGYKLYSSIWDNQPPLHTGILSILFRLFGPSIAVARGLAVFFGILLLAGCYSVMRQRFGIVSAYASAACLLMAPQVYKLSIAAMLEVPAFATGVWALFLAQRWVDARRKWHLVACALVFAMALQIKLTAALLAPAIVAELLLASKEMQFSGRLKDGLINGCLWLGVGAAGFVVLMLPFGWNYDQICASVFSPRLSAYVSTRQDLQFNPWLVVAHRECLLGGIVALGLICKDYRHWRKTLFLLVACITTFLVHLHHRPYWDYYYLHFAIPLSMLTGYAIGTTFRLVRICLESGARARCVMAAIGAVALVGFVVYYGSTRFLAEWERIASLPRIRDTALVSKMMEYKNQTRHIYSRDPICVFHAKLELIPVIAVLPDNRYWSGRISHEEVWNLIKSERPEQLLLVPGLEKIDQETRQFIDNNYRIVYEDVEHQLYVGKHLK